MTGEIKIDGDSESIEQWKKLTDRIAPNWKARTNAIVKEQNPDLYQKLCKLESKADSLMVIKKKPRELKKRFREVLDEYERVANCCIAYADRIKAAQKN